LNILYKITIFEISFELSKIFKNGFYQKVPRKNLEKLNLKQEKLILNVFKSLKEDLKWIYLKFFVISNKIV
jgi:hypothetical protein